MALKKTMTIAKIPGTQITDAYISVSDIHIKKVDQIVEGSDGEQVEEVWKVLFSLRVDFSREAKRAGAPVLDFVPGEILYSGNGNVLEQVYVALKSLPEFADAVDC